MRAALSCLISLLVLWSSANAQPTLTHTSPAAISSKGGQITLHGTGLKEPLTLWSIPQAQAIFSNISPTSVTCQIKPDTHDPFLALRLATSSGISNPILIAIDDLATIAANDKSKSVKNPQPLELPTAVEGVIDELTSHFYKFPAHKGRRLVVDVVANRIGSRLDPLVRLFDSGGKELIFCDDDPAIAPDSRFTVTIPSDGDYILEIRDAAYEGSPQHRYRLRVSETDPIEHSPRQIHQHPATLPATRGQEPNDTRDAATPFQIPAQLQGDFSKPHDPDVYEFSAKKDDHLLIRSKTRSIGSPCDLFLRITDSKGGKVADSKSDTPDEASISVTIKEDGKYFLSVEELTGQSGPYIIYQLDVEPFAGFSLTTETEKLDIPAGGQAEFKITANRREYKGPINLSLDSHSEYIHAFGTIPENKTEVQVKIIVYPKAPVGQALSFRIIGRARIDDRDYTQPLSTYPALKKLFPLMHYPPPILDGEIGVGVKPPAPTTTTAPATKPTSSRNPVQQ
jgi:hypothetical protein